MRSVAVVLNRNARRVTPRLVEWMAARLPAEDLFVTRTLDEGAAAARAIAERGYGAVCIGGGDGTFMQVAGGLLAASGDGRPGRVPALLPLRLGTGNAICDVCRVSDGSRAGLARDLARARGDAPPTPLALLRAAGIVTHFSGVGLDARYAEDHRTLVKERLARGRLGFLFRGGLGYVLAAALRTIPRLATEAPLAVRVVNEGAPARRLDEGGRPVGDPIPTGATIHEGPITIAAASTVAFYSSRVRFFPFVDGLDGAFQLRISSARPLEIVRHLRGVFAGTYRNPATLWDFAVTSVSIAAVEPAPCHAGGDVLPRTERLSIALHDATIPLLRA